MTKGISTLVLGGARSGKSSYAEGLADNHPGSRIYVATARAWDDEMKSRIAAHVDRRDPDWQTIEEPLELPSALATIEDPAAFVLVDCLTLWLTNILLDEMDIGEELGKLTDAVSQFTGTLVLVSNEVGQGIVPENALARRFRDEAGVLNQKLARITDSVVLVTAGLPLTLK